MFYSGDSSLNAFRQRLLFLASLFAAEFTVTCETYKHDLPKSEDDTELKPAEKFYLESLAERQRSQKESLRFVLSQTGSGLSSGSLNPQDSARR